MVIRTALLLLVGIFAAQHNRVPLSWDHIVVLMVAIVCLFAVRRLRPLCWVLVGGLLFFVAIRGALDAQLDPRFAGDSMLTTVRVLDFPDTTGASAAMLVEPVNDSRLPRRSRLTWFEPPVKPRMGDLWQLEVRLRRPRGAANPGGFDVERWMLAADLNATGYVVPGKRNRLLESGPPTGLAGARYAIHDAIGPHQSDAAAVLAAIAVGSRDAIRDAQWERYARTGTSHLIAISGLHVGLAASVAFIASVLLLSIVPGIDNRIRAGLLGSLLLAGLYAALSGFAVPAQRAFLMLSLAALASLLGRQVVLPQLLATTACIVLVIDPLATLTPGFSLSFAAVAVLSVFGRSYWRTPSVGGRPLLALRQLCAMQVMLLLGLAPLTVMLFERVALWSIVVNLVAVPVFTLFVVPVAMAGMGLLPVSIKMADSVFDAAIVAIELIDVVATAFADMPLADTLVAELGIVASLAMVLPLLWLVLPRGLPGRSIAWLALCLLLQYRPPLPPQHCFDTTVLDVGQGLAVVIEIRDFIVVYDTGPSYRSGDSAANRVLLPFLRRRGVEQVDLLIVSHGDLDHAGGVSDLVGKLPVQRILTSERLPDAAIAAFRCREGQQWSVNGVVIRVLHPSAGSPFEGNNASCVVDVSAGNRHLLLTGDIEAAAEAWLLQRDDLPRHAIVTVPHHGSLTSSSPALINRLQADTVIAAAGYANRWSFPRLRVRLRWEGSGARFLNTAEAGALRFRTCSWRRSPIIREERAARRRAWHLD